ncbi:tonsoku-like protein [Alca torda]
MTLVNSPGRGSRGIWVDWAMHRPCTSTDQYKTSTDPYNPGQTKLQKAKEKAQRSGSPAEEAALCNQLGEILASPGRYEEALEEHRRELRLLEGSGDGIGCAVAHHKVGERLAKVALKHQRQHLQLAWSLSDDAEQQRAWATVGRTYVFMADSRSPEEEAAPALREAERAFGTSLAIVEEKLEGEVVTG